MNLRYPALLSSMANQGPQPEDLHVSANVYLNGEDVSTGDAVAASRRNTGGQQMRRMNRIAKTATILLGLAAYQSAFSFEATIRWNDLLQRIDGFGACAGHGARKWASSMSATNKPAMMDVLFDTTTGAGLSIIRAEVPYNLSGGSGAFTTNDDGQTQFMREALKRNPNILMWAAPWSPPPAWKTSGKSVGGKLIASHYQDYANYLSVYARESKTYLSPGMYAISMQNEPHFQPSWDGCQYEPWEIRDFIKNNLGPAFARDGVTSKIMIPESNWDQDNYYQPSLQDPDARKYLGIIGLHFYHDSKLATPHPEVAANGLDLWETECSWAGNNGPAMIGAQFWYRKRHYVLTQTGTNAWHYWWFWDSAKQEGLLTSAPNWGYLETKRLWTLGNYSRFIKRGWRMMSLKSYDSSDSTLMVDAYRDETSGRFAILAANFNNMGRSGTVNIHLDGAAVAGVTPWVTDETHSLFRQADIPVVGGCFSVTLPAMTVVTYVGNGAALSPAAAQVTSFTSAKQRQIPGEATALSWATTNASSVSIDNGVSSTALTGSATISPTTTTTYTLTAQGTGGPIVRRVTVEVLSPHDPVNVTGLNNGLDYAYYATQNGTYDDFSGLMPTSTGSYAQFSHSPRGSRNVDFGFKIMGYIDIPTDGVYTFIPRGYGTMLLHVDGVRLLNQDYDQAGFGGLIDFLSGSIGLKAGKHSIVLGTHFAFGASDPWLKMEWEGPGIVRQEIPAARLFHNGTAVVAGGIPLRALAVSQATHTVYNMRGQRLTSDAAAILQRIGHAGVLIDVAEQPGIRQAKTRAIAR